MSTKNQRTDGMIAENRKARHEYIIENSIEAGIALVGSEVKSIRVHSGVSLVESHAGLKNSDEIFLFNTNIPEYKMANNFNHDPKRPRRLLLRKREINKIINLLKKQGITLVPLKMYFNSKGIVKLLLGIAKGKKKADKREAEKQKDWNRKKEQIMKHIDK